MMMLALFVAGVLAVPELTAADRAALAAELQASQRAVVETVKDLSPEQLAFKPGPDRWSVAECLEHIAATEPFLFGMISGKVLAAPPATDEQRRSTAGKDQAVMGMVTNRTAKFQAVPEVRPTGRWTTRAALLAAVDENRGKTIAFVKATSIDLRAHVMAGPGGDLDGYQWIMFLSGHTRRHLAQIQEVMANPGFPKGR